MFADGTGAVDVLVFCAEVVRFCETLGAALFSNKLICFPLGKGITDLGSSKYCTIAVGHPGSSFKMLSAVKLLR